MLISAEFAKSLMSNLPQDSSASPLGAACNTCFIPLLADLQQYLVNKPTNTGGKPKWGQRLSQLSSVIHLLWHGHCGYRCQMLYTAAECWGVSHLVQTQELAFTMDAKCYLYATCISDRPFIFHSSNWCIAQSKHKSVSSCRHQQLPVPQGHSQSYAACLSSQQVHMHFTSQ